MALTRRDILKSGSVLAASAALATSPLLVATPALAESVDIDALMKEGNLPDLIIGDKDAPVTIVEYFSMTCGHCATFHKGTYKHIKKNYIDTGKVRFIPREFPLDPLARAGAMLARCAPNGRSTAIIDLLLEKQNHWAYGAGDPVAALVNLVKQAGFTQESFLACVTDKKLLADVQAVGDRGSREFGVNSTPTFFVNGEKHVGALSIAEFDKILAPLVK